MIISALLMWILYKGNNKKYIKFFPSDLLLGRSSEIPPEELLSAVSNIGAWNIPEKQSSFFEDIITSKLEFSIKFNQTLLVKFYGWNEQIFKLFTECHVAMLM